MKAILESITNKKILVNSVTVITNNPLARGIKIANKFGIEPEIIQNTKKKLEYDNKIISILKKHNVTPQNGLICLAGFMKIIGNKLIKKYKGRIMNIHPSLLPAFPGLDAQKQALEYGVKYSGCTVHFVDEGIDTGPIILQDIIKIKNDDTNSTIAKKILIKEHKLYTKAIELFVTGRIKTTGRIVRINYNSV